MQRDFDRWSLSDISGCLVDVQPIGREPTLPRQSVLSFSTEYSHANPLASVSMQFHRHDAYGLRQVAFVVLSIAAMFISNRRAQLALVLAPIAYQVSWIVRLYDILQRKNGPAQSRRGALEGLMRARMRMTALKKIEPMTPFFVFLDVARACILFLGLQSVTH